MTAADDFFLSDGDDERPIHIQSSHSGPSRRCQRHNPYDVPAEVFILALRPWVKQRRFRARIGIGGCLFRPLSQRTRHARQGEVVLCSRSIGRSGHDVVDVKRRLLSELR